MQRRDIIKITSCLTGAALSTPLILSLISGCQPKQNPSLTSEEMLFSTDEFNFLKSISDTILPKTDSPSASEVGVPEMILHMISKVYAKDDKEKEIEGFKLIEQRLNSNEMAFGDLQEQDRINVLLELETSEEVNLKEAFTNLKQQVIAYYLSTEVIGTEFLNYLPVPGKYEPCISLSDAGGKAWSS